MTRNFVLALLVAASFVGAPSARAQSVLNLPRDSQGAQVMQRVGITDLTISYHRPLVRGRKVWGNLVPYGQVWRATSIATRPGLLGRGLGPIRGKMCCSDRRIMGGKNPACSSLDVEDCPTRGFQVVEESGWNFSINVHVNLPHDVTDQRERAFACLHVNTLAARRVRVGVEHAADSGKGLSITFQQFNPLP